MPQNEHIERHAKTHGKNIATVISSTKRLARAKHTIAKQARVVTGQKAKVLHKKHYTNKLAVKKTILAHEARDVASKSMASESSMAGALPSYLLDRGEVNRSKVLSNMVKQKRKEKAGKWQVPIPKVKALEENEMFQVLRSGKRKRKQWKRVVNKVCFVGDDFTRRAPKYEKYIRPSALRFKKANVTHPELKATFYLEIIGVKKNPQSALYTSLGVITKGSIIEVNCSDLGLVTENGKVVWGKYAQVTNNPELDGCINATLLV